MPMVEDIAQFLDVNEHATQAVLDNVPVLGIFDNAYLDVINGVSTLTPMFMMSVASAPRAAQGSTLRIVGGATYTVNSHEPDGTGWVLLRLERKA